MNSEALHGEASQSVTDHNSMIVFVLVRITSGLLD